MLHECKNICDLSLKIFVVPGCAARLQHQELHIGLEQRHPPVRAAGLLPVQLRNLYLHESISTYYIYIYIYNYLQARADAELAAPQPRQRAGQRAAGDGDRGEGVQDTHGARAGPLRQVGEKYWKIFVDSTKNICSPHLDELSGMTYLSYFMKEEDSPGYYSTLNWVKNQIPNFRINNFRVSLFLLLHLSTYSIQYTT